MNDLIRPLLLIALLQLACGAKDISFFMQLGTNATLGTQTHGYASVYRDASMKYEDQSGSYFLSSVFRLGADYLTDKHASYLEVDIGGLNSDETIDIGLGHTFVFQMKGRQWRMYLTLLTSLDDYPWYEDLTYEYIDSYVNLVGRIGMSAELRHRFSLGLTLRLAYEQTNWKWDYYSEPHSKSSELMYGIGVDFLFKAY